MSRKKKAPTKYKCLWCHDGTNLDFTVIDDDFAQPVRSSMIKVCPFCGKLLDKKAHIEVECPRCTREFDRSKDNEDFIQHKDGNMFPEPITYQRALRILCEFFLGPDWYINDPLSDMQVNVYRVHDIMKMHPWRYRKFCKRKGWKTR